MTSLRSLSVAARRNERTEVGTPVLSARAGRSQAFVVRGGPWVWSRLGEFVAGIVVSPRDRLENRAKAERESPLHRAASAVAAAGITQRR
jgi:hypothetical protein